jgi:FlaA1/EpsC-like NDP-sugar epimerase
LAELTSQTEPPTRRRLSLQVAAAAARIRGDAVLTLLDATLVSASLAAMMLVRFDGTVPPAYWQVFVQFLPQAVLATLACNWAWRLYGQIWRFASIIEARRVLLAGVTSVLAVFAINEVNGHAIPLSAVVFGGATATMLMGALRFQSRLFAIHRRSSDRLGMRVLVLGAGDAGVALVRDMLRTPRSGIVPVGILDDDPRMHGRSCGGVRVLGTFDDLTAVVAERDVHQAVLAVPSAGTVVVRRAADLCDQAGIALRVLPPLAELVDRRVSLRDVRDVRVSDLLGRKQVQTDLDAVRALLHGRRVLVTGAGGSIGSEIARQVTQCDPAELLLLDHDETHLHDTVAQLHGRGVQLLADIRDREVVDRLFDRHRPEVVFHAAAHKHVPLLETHACEAVRTNVIGTENIVRAAAAHDVVRLVFVSTDKAVRPSSVMGASKLLGEQVTLSAVPRDASWCGVRFGNVLGSRGSVVPTFVQQIRAGGPVTVTDARMTRFFMSVEEAVQLVLQAATMCHGGEIFMLEMGEPVRIMDLAERMIRISGRRVGTDVEIRVTGTRPGEKLAEELHTPDERPEPTSHPSIVRLHPAALPIDVLETSVHRLAGMAARGDDDGARELLFHLARNVRVDAVPGQPAYGDASPLAQVVNFAERDAWSRSST